MSVSRSAFSSRRRRQPPSPPVHRSSRPRTGSARRRHRRGDRHSVSHQPYQDTGIETVTTFEVTEVIRGFVPNIIEVHEPGGALGGRAVVIPGVPRPTPVGSEPGRDRNAHVQNHVQTRQNVRHGHGDDRFRRRRRRTGSLSLRSTHLHLARRLVRHLELRRRGHGAGQREPARVGDVDRKQVGRSAARD